MYKVSCKQCGASSYTDNGANLQGAVGCRCCTIDHDHQQAADSCPDTTKPLGERHDGAPCPHPSEDGTGCNHLTPFGEPCPGGHCWPGVPGCTVCRPLQVDWAGVVAMGTVL